MDRLTKKYVRQCTVSHSLPSKFLHVKTVMMKIAFAILPYLSLILDDTTHFLCCLSEGRLHASFMLRKPIRPVNYCNN